MEIYIMSISIPLNMKYILCKNKNNFTTLISILTLNSNCQPKTERPGYQGLMKADWEDEGVQLVT